MKDGKCPKCGATEISKVPRGIPKISTGITSAANFTLNVCVACGYSELWLESAIDRQDLAKLHPPKKS